MGKHTSQYIRVYQYMINDLKLSGNSLIIYAYIHGFTDHGQECFATQSSISRLLNIDRSTVHRILSKLEKRNMIEILKDGERITYKAVSACSDGDYFDIFANYLVETKSNDAVILSYLKKNMKENLSSVAKALRLSLNTVCDAVKKMQDKGLLVKDFLRNSLGQIKGVLCRFGSYKKCNTVTRNATTDSQKCLTYTKTEIKTHSNKSIHKNKFNNFEQHDYDFDKIEAFLLSN